MKGFYIRAMKILVDKNEPVSKLFGPYKTEVRKEVKAKGLPKMAKKLSEKQYIVHEAYRRTHKKIKEDDKYKKYRKEYDQLVSDATNR
ncbi:MAG: hypothetical protein ABSE63_00965 [Thermoguttaceae bacterium]|jgi:hypothetical protein